MLILNIVPKIADCDFNNIDNISLYLLRENKVEIQLLGSDLLKSFSNVVKLIDNFKHLQYVVLHMPFSMVNICYVYSNLSKRQEFIKFIVDVIKLSINKDIEIDILFHVSMRSGEFVSIGGIEFLKYIISLVENTKVGFLLENSIINLSMDDKEQDTIVTIFKNIDSEKLNFCLDLCHWQSSEYVWGSSLKLDEVLLNNLKNVHFSMTLEKDGYKNKARTHGRGHDCMKSCIRDLEYLRKKGIGLEDINLVTEINEEDYKRRPVMHKELYYLWGIRLKCRKVKGVNFDECRKVKIKRVS